MQRLQRARASQLARRLQAASRSRLWLRIELGLIFFGIPTVVLVCRLSGFRLPLVPTLLVVCAGIVAMLVRDPHFDRRVLATLRGLGNESRRVLLFFAVSAAVLMAYTAWVWPERFLDLPRERPWLWAMVMVLYPVLSVLPQELIYRVYFFHRYSRAVGDPRVLLALSAVAFGYVHVLYGAWISVILTLVGGLLFGLTYLRTRSIWLVSLEHALYGCFLFTVGLGRFFYEAV
ncbi:CPBP family intramembrane glutamic endopeptidase [Engelhardtia mirabilis]|uniref:CAAX amino terminal protease self-immunity n=1 Tax=Engelhardtia mirabilis TaxID=2528011 RepID=A0A518BLF5_9BACT|nr:CAAX amino terminal protease self- immunity [Planctomycetes bacterium Pla133]QDV02132.1 CAAX amino terminal protease self- immunity [Planctomycetes bacterium Pla86]